MVKFIVGLLVVGGLGVLAVYQFGGVGSFDPTAQGRAVKEQIAPGMTAAEVIAIDPPGRWLALRLREETGLDGEPIEVLHRGAETRYEDGDVRRSLDAGRLADGFVLCYFYSSQVAFEVWCDGDGTVTSINDVMTAADLLETREY